MAIRFQSIFPTERGVEVTLNIHDSEYVGAVIPFNTDSQGYRLSYAEVGAEQNKAFMSTQCEVVFRIEDETHFLMVTDFLTSQEGRFLISIEEDAVLIWVGVVLPDVTKYDESPFPIDFTLKAADGVGALKDVPFKDGSSFYTGKARVIEFITRALSKIVYVPEFYGTGDVFVRSAVDWWEENMTKSSSGSDFLFQAYLDNAVYFTYKNGVQDVMSCYDVLNDILTSFGLRMSYAYGAFHIEQLPYRIADIVIRRAYDVDGAFISAANYTAFNEIDQTAQGALLATGEYEFTAPISKAEHKFAALERRNFFAGAENVDDTHTGIDTFYVPIHANTGQTTLRMTGGLVLRISSNISEPGYTAPLFPFVVILRINLELTTVGLQRLYTLQPSYQIAYATPTWDATPGCYILQPIYGAFLANTSDDIFTFAQAIDIVTPALPENAESFTFSIGIEALKDYQGNTLTLANFDINYEISNLWLEAWSNGGPVLSGDGNTFYTNNTETQNTLVWKTEGLIGSSTNPNTVGAIWAKPASDYILAELWGAGADTPSFSFIGQMLTRDIAATHAKPARKLNGTLYGDIESLARVLWQSENWILLGGTWNAVNNLFSGTWIEMKTVTGLTPSAPIKWSLPSDPNPPDTTTSLPGLDDGAFRMSAPLGSIWYAIASTLTDEDIRPSTPGTIDIQDVLSDYDFNSGDEIAIIDPFSGRFETLEITTTTSNGETALVVSGTLVGSYPVGSPIVRIPRIGGPFSLPGGVSGQIMRHDGTKWLGYGTTALADGVVLTWTDAGGWAAAAPATSGTVTSVALALPTSVFDISGSPVTGSGTLTATFDNQSANTVFAGPTTGGAATPAFRALVAADLPSGTNLWTDGGATTYLTATGDNVAIGGTSATQKLDVLGDIRASSSNQYPGVFTTSLGTGRISINAGSNSGLSIQNSGSEKWVAASYLPSGTNYSFTFYNVQTGSDGLFIRGDDNFVGFGTNSPQQRLHVAGTARITGSDGTATALMGRDGDGDISAVGLGSTLSITSGTLNSTNQTITLSGDVTGSGTTAITTTIANNAVTVGKMAQLAGLSILARASNSTGNVAALTASVASTYLRLNAAGNALEWGALPTIPTISGTAGQVAVFTGASTIGGGVSFLYDSTNFRLQVNGSGSVVTPTARLDVRMGVVSGTDEAFRYRGQVSDTVSGIIENTRNISGTGNAGYVAQVGGTSAGNPYLQFVIPSGETFTMGLDNSDGDKFKLRPQTSIDIGATGGEGLTMTGDVTPLIGINTDTPSFPLDVNGRARALTWTNRTEATAPSSTFGTGAGTGPTLTTLSYANGNMAQVRFTTGTSPTANGVIINMVPPSNVRHSNKIYVVFSPVNAASAGEITKFYIDPAGTTPANIRLTANGTLTASTEYYFNFIIMGHA